MAKTTHSLVQGAPEWAAHRAQSLNASDAAAMLGISPYKTRDALIREKATGLTPDVDEATQQRFDRGHQYEAMAMPWAEEIIGDDLYPAVMSNEVQGLKLSASFDGIDLMESVTWEHKTGRVDLLESLERGVIPEQYHPQLEQGLMVSGAEKCLFMASSGDKDAMRHAWYVSNPSLRVKIIGGWKQFMEDVAAYQPSEVLPPVVATVQPSLPAPVVRMDGALTVASNLPDFAVALRAYIERIPKAPSTDIEFADCEAACKSLKKAEDALQQAEDGALAQMTDVEQMRRVVGDLRTLARTTRLASEKMVAARKDQIRQEIYQGGISAYQKHIASLNARLGRPYMPTLPVDFAGAIKNKRTVDSLRDAVATHLATAKIAANEVADRIQLNLDHLRVEAADYAFLFADTAHIVLKAPEDLQALVANRINAHKQAEADRLERERAAIAEQERVKAEAKMRAEQAAQLAAQQAAQPAAAPVAQGAPSEPESTIAQSMQPRVVATLGAARSFATRPAVQAAAPAPIEVPPTLRMGAICERLGFIINVAFLEQIGVTPAGHDIRKMPLFHDHQFEDIGLALIRHIESVMETAPA